MTTTTRGSYAQGYYDTTPMTGVERSRIAARNRIDRANALNAYVCFVETNQPDLTERIMQLWRFSQDEINKACALQAQRTARARARKHAQNKRRTTRLKAHLTCKETN